MCGITGGIWNSQRAELKQEVLDRMVDILSHRGPDDRGTYLHQHEQHGYGVALGHRRLSILDLSPLAHQPMFNEDGTLAVVFNGEIYNYRELREPLLKKGHVFRSTSDTEVLLPLYEEHGTDFLSHLNGMFALALWDSRKEILLLARDRFGKKPLLYKHEPNRLIFASELKSLLQVPGVSREIDPLALDGYLSYQYVPHPRTIYRNIQKLPPGHYAIYDPKSASPPQVRQYWNFDFNEEIQHRSFEDWSEELRELLCSSVQIRMRSDVPLGAFLSGGIDSTIITGLMQRFSSQKVKSFSIGFPQREYDETSFAREAAAKFGTEHEEFFVTPDAKEILPKLVWFYDEPFSDSSAIPSWYLSELTRKHVSVALSGDAGDELFAGYERYQAVRLGRYVDLLPKFLRRFLAGPLMRIIPSPIHQKSRLRRMKRFLEAFAMPPMERYLQWIAIFNRSRKAQLYSGEFAAELARNAALEQPPYEMLDFLEHAAARSNARDAMTSIALTDLVTYLPCDLMCKVDIASMAHSLECRAPFLDHRLVEHAIRMPIEMKVHGKTGKHILRETFRDLFPPSLLTRRKMGFGVPLDHWFRGPLADYVRDVLLDRRCTERGYFDSRYVERLLTEHREGRFDHAGRLWSLLFLELWMRQWLDSP